MNINEHSKSFIGQKYHASLKTSTPIQNLSDIGKYAWQSQFVCTFTYLLFLEYFKKLGQVGQQPTTLPTYLIISSRQQQIISHICGMLIGSIENRKMARVGKMFQSRRTTVWFLIFAVVVAKAPPSLAYLEQIFSSAEMYKF